MKRNWEVFRSVPELQLKFAATVTNLPILSYLPKVHVFIECSVVIWLKQAGNALIDLWRHEVFC